MFQLPVYAGRLLVGGIIVAVIGAYTTLISPIDTPSIHIDPQGGTIKRDAAFTVSVVAQSDTAVNAFSGEILFDPVQLAVEKIDYNTSIADLWVEEPWYSAGAGSIRFAGGTTKSGGFSGEGPLVTITFRPTTYGAVRLALVNAHMYAHDGFGTEAALASVDALFSPAALERSAVTIAESGTEETVVAVVEAQTNLDLTGDGAITFADISVFLLYSLQNDIRYDFNRDGTVDGSDLDLLRAARE